NPNYTYSWSLDSTLTVGSDLLHAVANPASSTTYYLTVKNDSCQRVFPIPVVRNFSPIGLQLSTNHLITCDSIAQVKATVSTSASVSYVWTDSTGTQVDFDAILNVAAQGIHTYTVVVTNNNGCTASQSVTIEGQGIQDIEVQINYFDPDPCIKLPVNIDVTGNPDYTYVWTPDPTLTAPANSMNVVANPLTTTIYTLTVKNGACEKVFPVKVLRYDSNLGLSVNTNSIVTCDANATVIASVLPGVHASYQWFNSNGTLVDQDSILNVAANGLHTYTVVATNEYNCKQKIDVTINGQGVDIKIDTSMPSTACEGVQVSACVINLDPNDVLSYHWTSTGNMSIVPDNIACPMVSGAAGSYTLTVVATNQFNCKDTLSMPISFEKAGKLDGLISLDLCNQLKVRFFNNSGFNGTWQFGDGSNSTSNNPTHNYASSGTYHVVFNPAQVGNCIEPWDTTIQVSNNLLEAAFDNTIGNCLNNASVSFSDKSIFGNAQIVNWSWTFANGQPTNSDQQNPTIQYLQGGNALATLVVTDALGCKDTLSKLVQVDLINLDIQEKHDICLGDSVYLNPNANSAYTYNWTADPADPGLLPNSSNPHVSPSATTNYTLVVKNGDCIETFKVTVTPVPGASVAIDGASDTTICNNGPISLHAQSNTNNVVWSDSPTFNAILGSGNSINVVLSAPVQVFYVKAGNSDCAAFDSIIVRNQAVQIALGAYENVICKNSSSTLQVINLAPGQSLVYQWSNQLPGISNPTVSPLGNIVYTVTATNAAGCTQSLGFPITVLDLNLSASVLGPDTIEVGGTANLLAVSQAQGGVVSYQWIPTDGLGSPQSAQTTAQPTQDSTIYTVIAQVDGRCPDTAQVIVYLRSDFCMEPYIFVPNAFTPNGDNNNDLFIVRFSDATELEFTVWNRWGEIVYKTTDIGALGWDGSYKGKDATPDSYAWYVRIRCGNGKEFKKQGNVTLLK
ncbi:MAG: gliding motility-associated C-terminal domain-containing protein, partial [Bacteroidetes bacterium]|nr:gliding motility-associated C-terminal domain-containing protein [Bacteroidota bacterium]